MVGQSSAEFPVARPWAKLRRRCEAGDQPCRERRCGCPVAAHLSLVGHSADVAAVLRRVVDQPTTRARLARLAGVPDLGARDLDRLAALAALHDLGKVNHGFQAKALPAGAPGPRCGHMAPLAHILDSTAGADPVRGPILRRLHGLPGLAEMLDWLSGEHDALLPLLAHHGSLPHGGGPRADVLWQPRPHYDPIAAVAELLAAIKGWLPAAFAPGQHLPWTEPFAHAFAGLLMLADWLGSDERRFGYGEGQPDGPERFAWSLERADEAIAALHLDPARRREAARILGWEFAAVLPGLAEAGHPPRPAQAAVLDLPPAGPAGRVVVLEAETGSGKTEAALVHFLDLLRQGRVDGLYFALPTRAAAVQIHGRVEVALRRCIGDAAPPVGLAVPGYHRVGTAEVLPDPSGRWPDDRDETLRDLFWAVERPKRYLAGAVMVGTVDQALTGALKVRHAQLRSAALLRLLLVVDEVHASDPYMTELLRRLLDQHVAAGGHALLMSATLGASARTRLTAASVRALPPTEAVATALPYPSLQLAGGEPQGLPDGGGPGRPPVAVELRPAWDDLPALAALAGQAAAQGARVLVLRNTVRGAVAAQQALEAAGVPTLTCGGVPALHHARFAAEDRKLLDAALEAALGKNAGRGSGLVAVATQTAEMALDLDADLLITDLCPADVLLQRLGRLHRHARRRPVGFERARAIVLAPEVEELAGSIQHGGEARGGPLGLGRVYPDLLGIVATRKLLADPGVVRVPQDCRVLVEAATHPDALKRLSEQLRGVWEKHYQSIWGAKAGERTLARQNAIDWRMPIQVLPDLAAKIGTRLGLDDREVELPADVGGPFGEAITRLRLPGWMVGDAAPEAEPTGFTLAPDGLTFVLGGRRFRYDRLGLR